MGATKEKLLSSIEEERKTSGQSSVLASPLESVPYTAYAAALLGWVGLLWIVTRLRISSFCICSIAGSLVCWGLGRFAGGFDGLELTCFPAAAQAAKKSE